MFVFVFYHQHSSMAGEVVVTNIASEVFHRCEAQHTVNKKNGPSNQNPAFKASTEHG